MITYSFTDRGSDTLYVHLYKCLKKDILRGVLGPGEKLPSKRNFAKNLGISMITVENAYAQLVSEGYIYSLPKKGFYVGDLERAPAAAAEQGGAEPPGQEGQEKQEEEYFADFSGNQTPPELFPFATWAKLIREVLSEKQKELMTNAPGSGILQLKLAISRHLKDFRGMEVSPEQIIVGAGTEYLYGLLIQLLGRERKYAAADPGYRKISQIYASHSAPYDFVSMDSLGVRIEELEEKGIDVVHTSPSHHFPSGIVMPVSRRYELLSWAAREESRYIIEDDYDSELRLCGRPIPALQSIDVSEKVIYMNTFTKTLASTIRISYMVLPRRLLRLYRERLSFYSCTVSNFEQYTLARFINEGYFEKQINRMRTYYAEKRDRLVSAIETSPLRNFVSLSGEDAGLHFLMEIDLRISDEEFVGKLARCGIKLTPLSEYYSGGSDGTEHVFVVNYSSVATDRIEEAIGRMCRCCREGRK